MTRRKLVLLSLLTSFALMLGGSWLAWDQIGWRAELVRWKLAGTLPDMSWNEVNDALTPGNRFLQPGILFSTGNPFLAIDNPYSSEADVAAGSEIFRSRCSTCHAIGGGHGTGPNLDEEYPRHGSTDWSLYRTIAHGIPGSAMNPIRLSSPEIWQVVAFVRSLRNGDAIGNGGRPGPEELAPAPRVSYDRLRTAEEEPQNWLTYSGAFNAQRHSRLDQIDPSTTGRMTLKWAYQIPDSDERVQTTPLVVDGIMYLTEPASNTEEPYATVVALDTETGRVIWKYRRTLPERIPLCCGRVNRGLAVLDDMLFVGTLDAHLVALDARTGGVMWETEVADYRNRYSITSAPLAIEDKVITGIAGGDFATRGFLAAYDRATGDEVWRFQTIPAPGEPGSETWTGSSWETGGNATWLTGSFDPELNLVYWGVGNPAPDYRGDLRLGDNLYSNSVIALDADSGELAWFFQFTPHDVHDWDSTQVPILVDAEFDGRLRKLMLWANRNAFYYVLDRQTGEFLSARPFAEQTWAEGIDSRGRPTVRPESAPSREGAFVRPGDGGTNWWSPSFSPLTRLIYVPVLESWGVFIQGEAEIVEGEMYNGGDRQGGHDFAGVRALDFATGDRQWEFRPAVTVEAGPAPTALGGLLSTAGNVVFAGIGPMFFVLDAEAGEELRRFNLGGDVVAAPITYETPSGAQQVTVAAGQTLFTFGLGD